LSGGVIDLTSAAESSLHLVSVVAADRLDQITERHQVIDPERAPTGGHRDEHVLRDRIGPPGWQRAHRAVRAVEEDPVLAPRLTQSHEHELLTRPRMERMGHPHRSSGILCIGCS